MKLKYDVFVSEMGENFVGVVVGSGIRQHRGLLKMNATGASILEKLREEITMEELVDKMAKEYTEETVETVSEVVRGFVEKLKDAELVE